MATVYIPLTQGKFALVDEEDAERLSAFKWYAHHRGYHAKKWYAGTNACHPDRRRYHIQMHRFILGAPDGIGVDHINGDTLDNRRSNIRLATPSQNAANIVARATNASGFKGVSWKPRNKKWQAQIGRTYLGIFATAEAAARAYDDAARATWGEFARLNFP